MVARTLVILVPLLVFSRAALLAATRALFPRQVRKGKAEIPTITLAVGRAILWLLQPLRRTGEIFLLEVLGVALTRVTRFRVGPLL